ncbi:hypothetical protein E1258_28190 [Micromonospora sp. KC207]|uniref:hypothetical protein n=1 Tax=Micromonospora sp. KC207 TaxID=2530377 RepID=UPI00104A8759|nr:hypothetical protein [Micromonospora sp. KC207]TDC48024.1 hypothetical protein E1258_28190 [Micromonospora sp. KC207]
MTDKDSPQVDPSWRADLMAEVASGDVPRATDALLSLVNHESERIWIESALLDVIDGEFDLQIRQLAVICLGHVARIHRAISDEVVSRLEEMRSDRDFSSRANNALEDVEIFARRPQG